MKILLLILSIISYLIFGKLGIIYLLFSTITSFILSKYLNGKHKKLILFLAIFLNLSLYLCFKFLDVSNLKNIFIPLGISYYTLMIISYLIDVYKGKIKVETNFFKYFLYVIYFPYIFIGPITKYEDFNKEISKKLKLKKENLEIGILRILFGLFKKFVIANRIWIIINTIKINSYEGSFVILACILYSIFLYCDFSGGIDIVLGISRMFNIKLKENFDVPFKSLSVKEFWNRWHIALGVWLRDYIYIPLGGNRCSKLRQKINVILTFLVSGFWHGVNYIFWGLFNGILVAFSNLFKTKSKTINQIITFILISLLWIFFIYNEDFTKPFYMFISIFTTFNYVDLFKNILSLGLDIINIILLVISVITLFYYDFNKEKFNKKIKNSKLEFKTFIVCSLIIVILLFGVYGLGFEVNDFIYSKF